MDNALYLWRRLFCFTKGTVAVHLSADWTQRCLFEPLGCKEMNSLAVLSQSFSGAWLFMGDSLHGPQSSPFLPVIAVLQKGGLCTTRNGVLLYWNFMFPVPIGWSWIHVLLIKSSCPCFLVGAILDGASLGPVCCLRCSSSLLFPAGEPQKERSLWNHTCLKMGKGNNGVKENKEVKKYNAGS